MNILQPVRTYQRKNVKPNTNLRPLRQALLYNNPKITFCELKHSDETNVEEENNTTIYDPFETTFDRLIKDAQLHPIPNINGKNSSNSSFNSSSDNDLLELSKPFDSFKKPKLYLHKKNILQKENISFKSTSGNKIKKTIKKRQKISKHESPYKFPVIKLKRIDDTINLDGTNSIITVSFNSNDGRNSNKNDMKVDFANKENDKCFIENHDNENKICESSTKDKSLTILESERAVNVQNMELLNATRKKHKLLYNKYNIKECIVNLTKLNLERENFVRNSENKPFINNKNENDNALQQKFSKNINIYHVVNRQMNRDNNTYNSRNHPSDISSSTPLRKSVKTPYSIELSPIHDIRTSSMKNSVECNSDQTTVMLHSGKVNVDQTPLENSEYISNTEIMHTVENKENSSLSVECLMEQSSTKMSESPFCSRKFSSGSISLTESNNEITNVSDIYKENNNLTNFKNSSSAINVTDETCRSKLLFDDTEIMNSIPCGTHNSICNLSHLNVTEELNIKDDKQEIKIRHNSEKVNFNNSKDKVKIDTGSEICNKSLKIVLTHLEDSNRINKKRQYTNWNLQLTDINESCNIPNETVSIDLKNEKKIEEEERTTKKVKLDTNNTLCERELFLFLKPGKNWTRSLSILHNVQDNVNLDSLAIGKGKKWRNSVKDVLEMQRTGNILSNNINVTESTISMKSGKENIISDSVNSCERLSRRISVRVVPACKSVKCITDPEFLDIYGIQQRKTRHSVLLSQLQNEITYQNNATTKFEFSTFGNSVECARKAVLQRCSQQDYIPFAKCFSTSYLNKCKKIGEGVYGEVFLYNNDEQQSVLKIIPIEGNKLVNGEIQKKFHEILSEIIIATELHNLRHNNVNTTDRFVEVKSIKCVTGKYPQRLIELWKAYDLEKTSDNDCPSMFDHDQLYIILELNHAGQDLEAFVFNTAEEAYTLFKQTALSLAIAEKCLEFEHRDMHWGNILISRTNELHTSFKLDNKEILLPNNGIKVTIIDFTLSRILYEGCSIFNDLEQDPTLFTAQGDYQFEIYRLMRDKIQNKWQNFEPFTNLLWLHYTLEKMITAVRYKKKNLKVHKSAISKLKMLKNDILNYNSVYNFVTTSQEIMNT